MWWRRSALVAVATLAAPALATATGAGGIVTATDYTAPGDVRTASMAIANACAAGALPFVSDSDLRRVPTVPARCPPLAN